MCWHKKLLVVALLTLLLGQPLAAMDTHSAQADSWAKVDPRVQRQIAQADEVEFLVVLREQADVSPAGRLATKEERGAYVYRSLKETAERSQRDIRAYLDLRGIPYRGYSIVNLVWVQAAGREALLDLAGRPEVARILPNPLVHGLSDLSGQTNQGNAADAVEWNIAQVHAPEVWSMGYTGQGAVVAGNDTGIDWDHPALINQYHPQYPGYGRHDYNWHDAIDNQPVPYDGHGHGTHTLGTIVGDDGGNNQIGMAPGARWIGCKNMSDAGLGSPASYIECFEFFLAPYPWTATPPGAGDPAKAPHVINNSWSCPPFEGCSPDTLEVAVDNLRAAGIEVVVSAGNEGSAGCGSVAEPPAIYRQSFSVGATNSNNNIASFSSRGPTTYGGDTYLKPEISAPGVSVRSSMPGGGYGPMSGTSMAAPHVAGLVALLISADPSLAGNPDALEQVITSTAVPKIDGQCGDPNPPNNVYGWGIIDALAAVEAVLSQGRIRGTVTDMETAGPIENAAVRLESTAGALYQVHTDGSGYYSRTLQPGVYTVTASACGYIPITLTGLVVPTSTVITQDLALPRAVVFDPDPLHVTVFWQSSYSTAAVVSNRMAGPYEFEFIEIPGGAISSSYGLSAARPRPDGRGRGAEVPWLGQEPLSGTVPAGGSLQITLTFTATPAAGVNQPGDYYATLVATGNPALRIPVTMTVVTQCLPVEVVDVTAGISGCLVSFGASMSGTAPFSYAWDFGPFGHGSAPTATVDFGLSGTYSYALTAFNCAGSYSHTYSGQVTVECAAQCRPVTQTRFSWVPTTPEVQQVVTFTASAEGTPAFTFTWDLGDGLTATGAIVAHAYQAVGTYTVTVTATNPCGQERVSQRVCVHSAPPVWRVFLPL